MGLVQPRSRYAPEAAADPPERVAALPMYDLPELADANDALWAGLAERLRARGVAGVPAALTRGRATHALWTDPSLLLAQTCGYPLATALHGQVKVVSTPRYRARGCEGPFYRSAVVVRAADTAANLADLRGGRCALNEPTSNSGMNLLRAEIAPLAGRGHFFSAVQITGSHLASAEAVAEGRAEVAAIDCVTFAQLQRFRPALTRQLKVLSWTVRSPGLPLVTAKQTGRAVENALHAAIADIAVAPELREARAELLLDGFNTLSPAHYRAVLYLEQIAADQGYPHLV